jgi:hypothetical protein
MRKAGTEQISETADRPNRAGTAVFCLPFYPEGVCSGGRGETERIGHDAVCPDVGSRHRGREL